MVLETGSIVTSTQLEDDCCEAIRHCPRLHPVKPLLRPEEEKSEKFRQEEYGFHVFPPALADHNISSQPYCRNSSELLQHEERG